MDKHIMALAEISEVLFPPAPWMFGAAGREHMKQYGTTAEHFAKIGYKNHKHSVNNPYAQFQEEYTLDDILGVADDLRPADQAAVLADLRRLRRGDPRVGGVRRQARSGGSGGRDRRAGDDHRLREHASTAPARALIGYDMNVAAAQRVYEQSGLGPEDFQVIELHDCFSANELLLYEALGLCGEGEAPKLIDNDDTTYGGRWVVNPSGGLISKGHPLGATGLAQCAELTWQLRGTADKRQVDNVTRRTATQHRTRWRGGRHRLPARRRGTSDGTHRSRT